MVQVLVGSYAAKQHFPNFREPKDRDYLVSTQNEALNVGIIYDFFYEQDIEQYEWSGDIASVNELYTIKISHIFWQLRNNSWNKHKNDIIFFKKHNAEFIPELYEVLYPIWEKRYGKKPANLEQEAEEFFNSNVKRMYEHDSIHASVAYYNEPLFNRILRDGSDVAVDKNKFDALSYEMKLQLVWEEVYATALERKMIPSNYADNPRVAYDYALRQLITSYSKGWFPLFVAQNLDMLYHPDPEIDYVAKHFQNKHKLILL